MLNLVFLHLIAFLGTKFCGLDTTVNTFESLGRKWPRWPLVNRQMPAAMIWERCQASYRWLPVPIRCLDQAIVIWYELNRAGYPAELKIGMTTTPMESHAWVECEGKVYVDIMNLADFTVLAAYAAWR